VEVGVEVERRAEPRPGLGRTLALGARLLKVRTLAARALPGHVRHVLSVLVNHGFEAHAVGGAVRDLFLGLAPADWDVATSARPRYVMSVFPRAIPVSLRHGTVRVLCPGDKVVDVTTYRVEGSYSDHRRPDRVEFTGSLSEDLRRRDFTVNALALDLSGRLRDPHDGFGDLARRVIRTVGDPGDRFTEDALRMLRAVRLSVQLGFRLDRAAAAAVRRHAHLVGALSVERVRDELDRCLVGPVPGRALDDLRRLTLLEHFIPELLEGPDLTLSEETGQTLWEHTIQTVTGVPDRLHLRLAALLHDVAKPRTLVVEDGRRRFVGHEKEGAEMAAGILSRLRYSKELAGRVVHLVRHHMALKAQPGMKDAAVRRLINRVRPEYVPDLVALRRADFRASTGGGRACRETAAFLVRLERLAGEESPFTTEDLAIDGRDIIRVGRVEPGPRVGLILKRLLEEVLEDPGLNEKTKLEERVREMLRPGGSGPRR